MMERDLRRPAREPDYEGICSVVAAAITGVAAVGSAVISSNAAHKASKAATNAAHENNALEREIYQENKGNLSPWMTRGNTAGGAYSALLGLGGNTPQAQNGLKAYLDSSGYKFRLDSGRDAITSSRATAGLLNSGSTLKALDTFGQNIGTGYFDDYLGHLSDLSGQGLGAGSALAGVGQNYAGAVSNNNNAAADAVGNAALSSAANTSNLLGSVLGAYGAYKGASSYGKH